MTERLYYEDSTLLKFEGKILEIGKEGGRYYTVLDRSAFYPTSGGQLFDTGTLNSKQVVDVIEREDNAVMHITLDEVGSRGDTVIGVVDSKRRFLQMQKHTAQHIFSAVAHREQNLVTMSVHLGEAYVAVELNIDHLSDKQLKHFEDRCNEIIYKSSEIEVLSLERAEAEKLPLRKPICREGTNRIIRIGTIDYQACGGTHCTKTSEVRMLKIIGTEKLHGQLSVQFLVGNQAFDDYALRFRVTSMLSRYLTCNVHELEDRVSTIHEENKLLRQEVARLQRELLPNMVRQLVSQKEICASHALVCACMDRIDLKLGSKLAGMVADQIDGVCFLSIPDRIIIGTSKNSGLNAGDIAKQISAMSTLRGGGSVSLAQLGGLSDGMNTEYFDLIRKVLSAL